MEKPYPTRYDIPVDVRDLKLPDSKLNPANPNNYSWHHYWFTEATFCSNSIYKFMRNSKSAQTLMLNDKHNFGRQALHSVYGPPKPPTLARAIENVEMNYMLETPLHYRDKTTQGWVERLMTEEELLAVKQEYNLYNV